LSKSLWGKDEGSSSALDSVANAVVPNESMCPSLSLKQRVIGFAVCAIIGVLFSILAGIMIFPPFINFVGFGVLYTLGTIAAIGSTSFLIGPMRQLKKMFEKTRIVATIVFLLSIVATMVVAFVVQIGALVLVCVVIQFLAFTWYSLSFIPFARDAVIGCCKSIVS